MTRTLTVVLLLVAGAAAAAAQDVLDRVLARVEGDPIMLSDARAAIRLGLVETPAGADPVLSAMRQLEERRLVLREVARFAPAEPEAAALEARVGVLRARVGDAAALAALERSTGYGEEQIRELARDDLRIEAYLTQRFGALVQATDEEVGQYYRTHPEEFTRDGQPIPFAEAEPEARARAAAARRSGLIFGWLRELRGRADVVELYPPK